MACEQLLATEIGCVGARGRRVAGRSVLFSTRRGGANVYHQEQRLLIIGVDQQAEKVHGGQEDQALQLVLGQIFVLSFDEVVVRYLEQHFFVDNGGLFLWAG